MNKVKNYRRNICKLMKLLCGTKFLQDFVNRGEDEGNLAIDILREFRHDMGRFDRADTPDFQVNATNHEVGKRRFRRPLQLKLDNDTLIQTTPKAER
jgi:hypothetical protein